MQEDYTLTPEAAPVSADILDDLERMLDQPALEQLSAREQPAALNGSRGGNFGAHHTAHLAPDRASHLAGGAIEPEAAPPVTVPHPPAAAPSADTPMAAQRRRNRPRNRATERGGATGGAAGGGGRRGS